MENTSSNHRDAQPIAEQPPSTTLESTAMDIDESHHRLVLPTSVDRVFAIPELLSNVFACAADDATIAVAARTCRYWSGIALDQLWKELDSIVPLLELLFPLVLLDEDDGPSQWEFSENLAEADWTRFKTYSSRVRTLTFNDADPIKGIRGHGITPSHIASAHLVHPFLSPGSFLPSLQAIDWSNSRDASVFSILPFLPPHGLKRIRLVMGPDVSPPELRRLFQCLRYRTPDLESLTISSTCAAQGVSTSLANWIRECRKLRRVSLPPYYHTPEIIAALDTLAPSLTAVRFNWTHRPPFDLAGTHLESSSSAVKYEKLEELHFVATSHAMGLRVVERWVGLKEVCITSTDFPDSERLKEFLDVLAGASRGIETVSLNLFTSHSSDQQHQHQGGEREPSTPLEFYAFRSLLACASLVRLEVAHDHPMTLTDSDIEDMGRAWKGLDNLQMCEDPYVGNISPSSSPTKGTPIESLRTLARACPNLTYLALYFSTTSLSHHHQSTKSIPLVPPHQLAHLGTLNVGLSSPPPPSSTETLAFFLGTLFPSTTAIHCGTSPWYTYDGEGGEGGVEGDGEKWEEVGRLAGMVSRAKESVETLERERSAFGFGV